MGWGKAVKGKGKASGPYSGGGGGREQAPDECKAFVGNLSFKTRFGRLKDHIRDTAGVEVKFANIMSKGFGKNGRPWSKGRAVIEFESVEDCAAAIAACNGT